MVAPGNLMPLGIPHPHFLHILYLLNKNDFSFFLLKQNRIFLKEHQVWQVVLSWNLKMCCFEVI